MIEEPKRLVGVESAAKSAPAGGRPRSRFLWWYVAVCGSLIVRFGLLDYESWDYRSFLSPWYDKIVALGRWTSLREDFVTYPTPYACLLSLSTLLPLPKLYAVKAITIVFDYAAAWLVYRMVNQRKPGDPRAVIAACLAMFLPTVLFNGALWGQCDVIFTGALLGCLYCILKGRPVLTLASFGLALAFKPQAIFLVPFIGGLFFCGLIPWRWFWVPGAVYAACGLPAILAGRPVIDTLFHYGKQTNAHELTMGATNWYQWLSDEQYNVFFMTGLALTVVASVFLILAMQVAREVETERGPWLVRSATLSVLLAPYFLPGMHERYFFPADLFTLVYAFYFPRRWYVAGLVQFASFFTYLPFLLGKTPVSRSTLAFAMTAALAVVAWDFAKDLLERSRPKSNERVET